MHKINNQLTVHLVWTTWKRAPFLVSPLLEVVHRSIASTCLDMKCRAIQLGGSEDHVHLLAHLHTTVSVSKLIGRCKGGSSHVASQRRPNVGFRWAPGYSCFSVSADAMENVQRYIEDQANHHKRPPSPLSERIIP